MSAAGRSGVDRAREELACASLLAEHGFSAQAVSRAYYALEAALEQVGEARSKQTGVMAAFASIVVRQHGVDAGRRLLRSLLDRRSPSCRVRRPPQSTYQAVARTP